MRSRPPMDHAQKRALQSTNEISGLSLRPLRSPSYTPACFWPDAPRPSSRTPLRTKYESREAIPATWGLVNSWAKDAGRASMCINAKAETVDKLPSFREAFAKRRCVVPADGFYEWRGPKARREPLWIHPADDGALLLFAGLFEAWQPQPGEWQSTFTIITTVATRTIEPS